MNPYLISLMIYTILITPLRLSISIRFGRRSGYRLRLQAAGLPFYRSRKDEDSADETPVRQKEMARQLRPANLQLVRQLLLQPMRKTFFQLFQMEWLSFYVHVSQPDAMQNALLYGALRSAADAVGHTLASRISLRFHLRTDFQGQGSEALIRCIVRLRVGSLLPAAFVWLWQLYRHRRKQSKEDNYAAASH